MAQPNADGRRHPDTAGPGDDEAVTEPVDREPADEEAVTEPDARDAQAPGLAAVGPDDGAGDVPEPNEPA